MFNYKKNFLLIPVALSMILAACGKSDNIVIDYGYQPGNEENQNEDKGDSFADASVSVSGGRSVSSTNQTVRDMAGGAVIEWEDSMEASGVPVDISLKCNVPDLESLSAYQAGRVSFEHLDEDRIVNNIFSDTADKLEELSDYSNKVNNEGYNGRILSAYNDFIYNNGLQDYFEADADAPMWIDADEGYMHIYEGLYDGVDFCLLFMYSDISRKRSVMLAPLKIEEYISEPECDDFFVYNAEENSAAKDVSLKEVKNRLEASPDELEAKACDFVENKLMLPIYKGIISADINDVYTTYGVSGMNELVFINSGKQAGVIAEHTVESEQGGGKFDTGHRDIENIIANSGVFDGYELYFSRRLSGVSIDVMPVNEGSIYLTSRGIMEVRLDQSVEINDITENIQILDLSKIKQSIKDVLADKLEKDRLKASNRLVFNQMSMVYYPVMNPKNEEEYTYIPAWRLMTNDSSVTLYINAIDGTLVDAVY